MNPRLITLDRVDAKIDRSGECWIWTGGVGSHGYGVACLGVEHTPKQGLAHRVVYELLVGPIPDGLQLDHLCRVPRCVRPSHLEPVTPRENVLRSNSPSAIQARQTKCKYGHSLADAYVSGGKRYCRPCKLSAERRRRAAA